MPTVWYGRVHSVARRCGHTIVWRTLDLQLITELRLPAGADPGSGHFLKAAGREDNLRDGGCTVGRDAGRCGSLVETQSAHPLPPVQIGSFNSSLVIAQLLYLESVNPEKAISMYINW